MVIFKQTKNVIALIYSQEKPFLDSFQKRSNHLKNTTFMVIHTVINDTQIYKCVLVSNETNV